MSEGLPLRALVWGLMTGLVLAAWPWLLAWLKTRRPGWLAGHDLPDLAGLGAVLQGAFDHSGARDRRGMGRLLGPYRIGPSALLVWSALVVAAALLPAGNGWQAADLDAGLLWIVVLAVAAAAVLQDRAPGASTAAAGGLMTLFLCLAPLVMQTASLHLGDLAVAQQGGAGNWFLVRDPFLLLSGAVYLLAAAALWPAPMAGRGASGLDGLFLTSAGICLPLVLAHLFTVAYLGGWWAFVPALDGLTWLQTALKNIAVLALLLWLRGRPAWCAPGHLVWRLPLAALATCLGAVAWLVLSGAVL